MRKVTTASGAVYTVSHDGKVHRTQGEKRMRYTQGDYQYTDGYLAVDHLIVGQSFVWYGVVNDKAAEIITTSYIVSIDEG